MREHARLAHARDLGQRADAQALQTDLRRQRERRVDDRSLGLLPFLQRAPLPAVGRGGSAGGVGGGHRFLEIKRTIVLFCRKSGDPPSEWGVLEGEI